jgi:16S rRNA pseudouridine516 synthase
LKLAHLLFTQGFGTRRECDGRLRQGLVRWQGQCVTDPHFDVGDPTGQTFEVEGVVWRYQARALLMLHKPGGFECSLKPSAWPSVLTLLPVPLCQRKVQCVGRLDQDTTGLLLLTDDGPLLHKLTSPKHHVPKVYEAEVKHPLDAMQIRRLREGVVLHGSPQPVRAEGAESLGQHRLGLTLTQGKYHQVKRMVAAVGNRVEALHRVSIGRLTLPEDLPVGQWRWVDDASLLMPERG